MLSVADLTLRPATLDDATFAADLQTTLRPDDPADPESVRYWWQNENREWIHDRLVIERDGSPIGLAERHRPPWERLPKRYDRIYADVLPRHRDQLDVTYSVVEARSRADGSEVFTTGALENDAFKIELLARRGYREERRGKAWELAGLSDASGHPRDPDLVERLAAMAEASRERMRAQGIRLLTLAEDRDPEKYRKLWRMSEDAAQDTPRTIPRVPEPFEEFMKWFDAPSTRRDRFWIARLGEEIVGCSVLAYPPTLGNVWTDWTGTARAVRGRGVARALKLETVLQAMALGVTRVRTGNDSQNAPILHINETMGYEPIPGWIHFMKEA